MKICPNCKGESFDECKICWYCMKPFPKKSTKKSDNPESTYHVPSNYQMWKVCRKPWYDARKDADALTRKGKNPSEWLRK